MDDAKLSALKHLRPKLLKTLTVLHFLAESHTAAGGFLNDHEEQDIRHSMRQHPFGQADQYLSFLFTKPNSAFDKFCSILEGIGHEELSQQLQEKATAETYDEHPSPWLKASALIPDIVKDYIKIKALFVKTCREKGDPDMDTLTSCCCDLIAAASSEKKRYSRELKACSSIEDIAKILFFDLSRWLSFNFLEIVLSIFRASLQDVEQQLGEYKEKLQEVLTAKLRKISALQRRHPERCKSLDGLIELVLEYDLDSDGICVQDLICEQHFLAQKLSIPKDLLQVISWRCGSVVFILQTLKKFESQLLESINEMCSVLHKPRLVSERRVGDSPTIHTLSLTAHPARSASVPVLSSSDSGHYYDAGTEVQSDPNSGDVTNGDEDEDKACVFTAVEEHPGLVLHTQPQTVEPVKTATPEPVKAAALEPQQKEATCELPLPRQEPIEANHLDFSCFSCREHVDQLSCLPCLHSLSVCERKECRQKLTERGAFCQHCNERFDSPVESYPRYPFAERKAAAKKMEEDGMFCYAKHNTPQVAVAFCSDCPGLLCEECHNGHNLAAFLKEHKIVSLEDTMKAGLASQPRPLLCPTHKKEVECFCQDCDVLICTVCSMVGPHQSHSVLFVDEEVGEQNRQTLEQCIRSAEKSIEEVSSAARDVDGRLLTLHEEGNRCKEHIADLRLKERMSEAMNRRCAVLVAEVEEAEEKRRRDLEQHKNALEAKKNQLELFTTLATEIVEEGIAREQLSLRRAVIQRASSLTSISTPPAPPSSYSVFFVPEKKEEVGKILSVMGHVSLGPVPEASSMEGLSIVDNTVECCPWDLPLSTKVVSRDCRGLEYIRGGERVESVLTPTSCGVPVQGEVEDRGDGTYQVTFRYLPSEECRLSVTVNGSDVRGSPVRVKLNDPRRIKQEIKDRPESLR